MKTAVRHADHTTQELRRRTVYGRTVPIALAGMTWNALVAAPPRPTGGAAANPDHPSRKHDTSLRSRSAPVPPPPDVPSATRRRDRRAASRVTRANQRQLTAQLAHAKARADLLPAVGE